MPSLEATPGGKRARGSPGANWETGLQEVAERVAEREAVPAKAAVRLAVGWAGAARAMVVGVMGSVVGVMGLAAVVMDSAMARAVTGSAGAGAGAARAEGEGICPTRRPQYWRSAPAR